MTLLNYMMLAEAAHPWALGVLVFILGVLGLFLLVRSGWENEKDSQSWRSQLLEGGIIICGLMVAVPVLMLLPEETRKSLLEDDTSYIAPHKGALVLFALFLFVLVLLVCVKFFPLFFLQFFFYSFLNFP